MVGAERQTFEAEVAADPALAEELDVHRLAREAIELSISDNLRVQMQHWQEMEASDTKNEEAKVVKMAPRRTLGRILAIAASVLLILATGTFWFANESYSADKMAMSYYESTPISLVRGDNDAPLAPGITAIQAGDYVGAETFLKGISEDHEYYADAQYLLGRTYYQQGEAQQAIEVLQGLGNNANPNLVESANWLVVLSYLQMGDTSNSDFQSLLDTMVNDSGHSFHPKAVELQEKLNSFWYVIAN